MLDDIRARLKGGLYDPLVAADVSLLLAEVERLQAEREQLRIRVWGRAYSIRSDRPDADLIASVFDEPPQPQGFAEQQHRCAVCGRNTVKLYRYSSFLRDDEIFCRRDAPPGEIDRQYLVPLCEDTDGSVWGYTSVPADAIERWEALPDD